MPHIGQHGMRKVLIDSSFDDERKYVWINNYEDNLRPDWTRNESLALTMESPINIGDRILHEFKGWFVPPATTRYRFFMSCDDHCFLNMSLTAGSPENQ